MSKHPALTHGIYSLEDLKKDYYTKTRGHWFDEDTLRFFKSRISESLIYADKLILFVSSEQGPNGIRRYSIRQYNTKTGNIDTIGLGFQGYKTAAAAKRAAQIIAGRVQGE